MFPRLKVSATSLEFGEVKERTSYVKEVTFFNDGERDICLSIEEPQQIKVEGQTVIPGHRNVSFKVTLRAVKVGKIA